MSPRIASLLAVSATSLFAACIDQPDVVEETAAAIEQENGGLDMEDEAPMFGVDDEFAAAAVEQSASYDDAMAEDTEIAEMRIDGLRARVLLVWGQLPPDPEPEASARNWSGRIDVNRGGIVVRRTIGFEEATDRLLVRDTRTAVAFTSVTRPFVDGLLLDIVDPTPDADEPFTLTYTSADGTNVRELALDDLIAGPVVADVDDQGNRVVASLVRDDDRCNHGFGRGRWRAFRPELGRLHGVIADADGDPIGHIRGVWGKRDASGEQVFFGKYIANDGGFNGIFAGHYRDGEMHGRWMTRDGEAGRLDGMYRTRETDVGVGGGFLLRWAETTCAQDIAEDSL